MLIYEFIDDSVKNNMILNKFPTADEFYKTYWGRKPFVVRGAVDQEVFSDLIDGDTLAGLALEEDIKSRIVITESDAAQWACHHGPFAAEHFSSLGDRNWSLLVQNVEQYHTDTAKLLRSFDFSPRWLMDDIMVSYSTPGGSVGSHTDSYHVFLVQGMGCRQWTIGRTPVQNEDCIDGLDLKVLKAGVEGNSVEVSIGDVIYIPPHFAHEGVTQEEAMTFSVGFLGPKISEMLVEYGDYLEQQELHNKRYLGQGLDACSAAFEIDPDAQNLLRSDLVAALQSDDFSRWLAVYFSTPTHDDIESMGARDKPFLSAELLACLQEGQVLYRPEHIKISMTTSSDGGINLAVYGAVVETDVAHNKLIHWLNQNSTISMKDFDLLGDQDKLMRLLTYLYNQNVLFF